MTRGRGERCAAPPSPAAGVEALPALPVGPWRSVVGRTDLRLHRKIVVVDGAVAWTGRQLRIPKEAGYDGEVFDVGAMG